MKLHLFLSFQNPHDKGRSVGLQCHRDVLAAHEVAAALYLQGYAPGEAYLNYPPTQFGSQEIMRVDRSRIAPGDLLLTPTRPSRDEQGCGRKWVRPGQTDLEREIQAAWDLYCIAIERYYVRLHPRLHPLVVPAYEDRREVFFLERRGAPYKASRARRGRKDRGREPRSAAFLVRIPRLGENGPAYIGIFAMDGVCTLVWAYLLRHRYSDLLKREGFTMVELVQGPIPDRAPDMSWADAWQAEEIVHEPFSQDLRRCA